MHSLQTILNSLTQSSSAISPQNIFLALLGSFVGAIVCSLLYQWVYGRSRLGAGVNRMFLLGGPAITAMLLAIQFSLPLSLGLLGALSIVRFRTPVKDPEEIGFILLLISGAIAFSVLNFWLAGTIYLFAIVAVLAQRFYVLRLFDSGRGYLVVQAEGLAGLDAEQEVSRVVQTAVPRAKLLSLSTLNGATSFQYAYSRTGAHDWGRLQKDLDAIFGSGKASLYAN